MADLPPQMAEVLAATEGLSSLELLELLVKIRTAKSQRKRPTKPNETLSVLEQVLQDRKEELLQDKKK